MLGLILAVLSSFLLGATTAMQKYAMSRIKRLTPQNLIRNKIWASSLLLGGMGILTYVVSLRYVSLLVVQPIITASLIIPVVAGRYVFGEKIGFRWFHITLILLGVVLLSA